MKSFFVFIIITLLALSNSMAGKPKKNHLNEVERLAILEDRLSTVNLDLVPSEDAQLIKETRDEISKLREEYQNIPFLFRAEGSSTFTPEMAASKAHDKSMKACYRQYKFCKSRYDLTEKWGADSHYGAFTYAEGSRIPFATAP